MLPEDPHHAAPYVGPRHFTQQDSWRFFGREHEAQDLASLIVSHNILILYAPSGAGKSSLLNTRLAEILQSDWNAEILPHARFQGQLPPDVQMGAIRNIFIYQALNNANLVHWAGDIPEDELTQISLVEFLARKPHQQQAVDSQTKAPAPRILIFDQFEELFTLYQANWRQREDFFNQVLEALKADPALSVVFAIREDFIAQFDPYLADLRSQYFTKYRLDRLRPAQAKEAITRPLMFTYRQYTRRAVDALLEKLRQLPVDPADLSGEKRVGEFIEPVQLQVICQSLWNSLGPQENLITEEEIKNLDVNQALGDFYDKAVRTAADQLNFKESKLRSWFDNVMITPLRTRGTSLLAGGTAGGVPERVVRYLDEQQHLVRIVPQRNANWVELSHDRLIGPIYERNRARRRGIRRNRAIRIAAVAVLLFALTAVAASLISTNAKADASKNAAAAADANATAEDANAAAATAYAVANTNATAAANAANKNDVDDSSAEDAAAENDPTVVANTLTAISYATSGIDTPTPLPTPTPTPTTPPPTATPTHSPAASLVSTSQQAITATPIPPNNGIELINIPAGFFNMGCDPVLADCTSMRSVVSIHLPQFLIHKTEVTNQAYQACVQAGVCLKPDGSSDYSDATFEKHPVTHITWEQANTFCRWAGGFLPDEAQWEKAARGHLDTRIFPWGNDAPTCDKANYATQYGESYCNGELRRENSTEFTDGGIWSTGGGRNRAGASPYGVLDMAGNVWEWTRSNWSEDGTRKVVRGGSWFTSAKYLPVYFRTYGMKDNDIKPNFGFRCTFPAACSETGNKPPCSHLVTNTDSWWQIASRYYDNGALYWILKTFNRSIDGQIPQSLQPDQWIFVPSLNNLPGFDFPLCSETKKELPCQIILDPDNHVYFGVLADRFYENQDWKFIHDQNPYIDDEYIDGVYPDIPGGVFFPNGQPVPLVLPAP